MRIGRNDPGPCGSGKRFKRCCRSVGAIAWSAKPVTAEQAQTLMAEWRAQLPPEEPSGVLCACGSGRDIVLCHARRFGTGDDLRELGALGRASDVPVREPSIRAQGPAIEAFAARVAATIDEDEGTPPPQPVEEGP